MPVLAAYPVVDSPTQIDDPFDDSRTLAFESLHGTTILPFTGDEFIAQWGVEGLDMPPRQLVTGPLVGEEGSTLDEIKVLERSWTIPIFLGSDSGHLPYLRNRAYMRSLFNHRGVDYRSNDGTFDVVASSVLGVRRLRAAYEDGLTGSWTQQNNSSYRETFGLRGRSVQPLWTGEEWTTPKLTLPSSSAAFFGRFPPRLSATKRLGDEITVSIPGDAGGWPWFVAQGPCPTVEVFGPGLYLRVPGGLGAGESCVISTDPRPGRRRAMFGGVNDWTRVAPSRSLAKVPPGDQKFTIDLGEAGVDAYAYVRGLARYETPW